MGRHSDQRRSSLLDLISSTLLLPLERVGPRTNCGRYLKETWT
jgi:hypothetical protein